MKNDLISVIITTYKRGDKLENAIKSVINQTYNNIEIIVVDDNSEFIYERKKTESIIKRYDSVKLIKNKKNLGGSLSRNVGIDASKGEIISFLDDDDVYLPTRIEEMYNCYVENKHRNIGLIYCHCDRVNDNMEILGHDKSCYKGLPIYNQMLNCIAPTSLWLASKKALIAVGKFEDAPCKQDSIVILKLLVSGYEIFPIEKSLVLYYVHNGSGISGTKKSNIAGLINYREWCRKYYHKLENDVQIKNVEFNFSKQLITLYVINNMKNEAFNELKNMIKIKPISRITFLSFIKIIFRKKYMKWLKRRIK